MPRLSPRSILTNQHGGAAMVALLIVALVLAAVSYWYTMRTGTTDEAATALTSGAAALGNKAEAEYHTLRADNLTVDASNTQNTISAAADSANAMEHRMEALEASTTATFQTDKAKENAAVVGTALKEQISGTINVLGNRLVSITTSSTTK